MRTFFLAVFLILDNHYNWLSNVPIMVGIVFLLSIPILILQDWSELTKKGK